MEGLGFLQYYSLVATVPGRVRRRAPLPLMQDIGDDRGKEAQKHDCGAGIHHGVQELPWVLGQGEDSLQILEKSKDSSNRYGRDYLRDFSGVSGGVRLRGTLLNGSSCRV